MIDLEDKSLCHPDVRAMIIQAHLEKDMDTVNLLMSMYFPGEDKLKYKIINFKAIKKGTDTNDS
jgi:hypothetical protein